VAVIDFAVTKVKRWPAWAFAILYALFGMSIPLMAAILPEERADVLYHRYEGDHVTVDGPSVLARKNFGKHTSVYANYYQDSITSASIDVQTSASQYTEQRTEYNYGADLLFDNTNISFGYTNSDEYDYLSKNYHFGISHNMFGDLTTVSLGFSYGDDTIHRNLHDANGNYIGHDPGFGDNGEEKLERRNYRLGLTQIMTKDLVMNFAFEAIANEGYSQNPYRTAFIYTPTDPVINGVRIPGFIQENYPDARTSDAYAIRANYFLPYRAAIHSELKYYTDTWGIRAGSIMLGYVHPIGEHWTVDAKMRYYTQTQADFYKDVYAESETNLKYYGHNKELCASDNQSLGVKVAYEFMKNGWWQLDKGSVTFSYDHIRYDFKNFSSFSQTPDYRNILGKPFLYDADVLQFFISLWY